MIDADCLVVGRLASIFAIIASAIILPPTPRTLIAATALAFSTTRSGTCREIERAVLPYGRPI